MNKTPISVLSENLNGNSFYMKREDLLPFSFGGNKARKAMKYREEIIKNGATAVITYGSSESNHCRIISNMCAALGIKCYIVSPEEEYEETFNSDLVLLFGAIVTKTPLDKVKTTIDVIKKELESSGEKVYFIQGGGHGNLGTKAYIEAYSEIKEYEKEKGLFFDYIFFASGTGTTQAGLVCGQIINDDTNRKIVGISIARKKEKGLNIILDSIREYLQAEFNQNLVIFNDDYVFSGYNSATKDVIDTIINVMRRDGVALNKTYTGKAYYGMLDYILKNNIRNKKILFVNTGGTPLFFDNCKEIINEYINN